MDIDYNEAIKIHENDLENDWLEQASFYLYFAEAHANALHERDLAKARCDYTYAVMYSEIKKDWKKCFDSKPTEPAIKEYIAKQKKYKVAERKYFDASKDANVLLGVKTAFEHRKLALSNLTSLKIGGFYSEPRNKMRDVENLTMKGRKKAHKEQTATLNKKTKKPIRAKSQKRQRRK